MIEQLTPEEKFDRFKMRLLQWNNDHREQYIRFAQKMNFDDGTRLMDLGKQLSRISPNFKKAVKDDAFDDTADNDQIVEEILEAAIGTGTLPQWIRDVETGNERSIGPLFLTWIVFGQAFEKVVTMMEDNIRTSNFFLKQIMRSVQKRAINVSVKNGYRTIEQWEDFLDENYIDRNKLLPRRLRPDYTIVEVDAVESEPQTTTVSETDKTTDTVEAATKPTPGRKKSKQIPLSDYIDHPNKERILSAIGDYIQFNNEGKAIALVYFVLTKLNIGNGFESNDEFAHAILLQYQYIDGLRKLDSLRHGLSDMKNKTVLTKHGEQPLRETGKYPTLLTQLEESITTLL